MLLTGEKLPGRKWTKGVVGPTGLIYCALLPAWKGSEGLRAERAEAPLCAMTVLVIDPFEQKDGLMSLRPVPTGH